MLYSLIYGLYSIRPLNIDAGVDSRKSSTLDGISLLEPQPLSYEIQCNMLVLPADAGAGGPFRAESLGGRPGSGPNGPWTAAKSAVRADVLGP